MGKRKTFDSCIALKRVSVKRGALSLKTGEITLGDAVLQERPCGAPIFSGEDGCKTGLCRVCGRGDIDYRVFWRVVPAGNAFALARYCFARTESGAWAEELLEQDSASRTEDKQRARAEAIRRNKAIGWPTGGPYR